MPGFSNFLQFQTYPVMSVYLALSGSFFENSVVQDKDTRKRIVKRLCVSKIFLLFSVSNASQAAGHAVSACGKIVRPGEI